MPTRDPGRNRRSKRLGQHFLVDSEILRKIADYAVLRRDEIVLEVGAGTGNLTAILEERVDKIIAVEKDPRLANFLREKFHGKKHVEIVEGDILKVPLPIFNKVVSSPPYYISSRLIFLLLKKRLDSMTMTFQREFASRLVAEPGSPDYGRLTVALQHRAYVELLDFIPKTAFRPIPRVDSHIVKIVPRAQVACADEAFLDRMIRYLFSQRKRTLRGVLNRAIDPNAKEPLESLVEAAALLHKRIFQLTPSELENLSDTLCRHQALFKF